MLEKITIRNLAVVEDAAIEFTNGLNVITGSTGAGKSIILAAVDLLSGGRARKSLIRKGAKDLTVEGIFKVSSGWQFRDRIGLEDEEETVSVKRLVQSDGKSRIWINGMTGSNSLARELASSLLELHGQHKHHELLDPSNHIRFLDESGDYLDLLAKVNEAIGEFRRAWTRLKRLQEEETSNREQEDFFRFQLREIDSLGLKPGLKESLEKKIKRITNIHRYLSSLERSRSLLDDEDDSISDRLSEVERSLESIEEYDSRWRSAAERVRELRITVQDISREIEHAISDDSSEPEDLESLQSRLALIQGAMRKYGTDCEGLMEKERKIRSVLGDLTTGSMEIRESTQALIKLRERLLPILEELSRKREETACRLDGEVTSELRELGIEGALFRTDIKRRKIRAFQEGSDELDLTPGGWDRVEFMIRTNVGEDIHPLGEIASGGELSRITLVLKKLLVRERGIQTLVFDEIDSGLGADLGTVVAEKMKELSERYQIICITHLPQVAAVGNQHVMVRKSVKGRRTVTRAILLDDNGRMDELARMLGGKGKLREELASELLGNGKSARSSAG